MSETDPQAPEAADVERRLRALGMIPTRQRLEIARLLLERPQHLSAEQLLARLRERGSRGVSKATVYNTLGLFARVGLVREVIADPTRIFYDSNTRPHHHLFDEDTGELTDLDPGVVDVTGLPQVPEGVEVSGVEVIVRVRQRRA
jgi:Fur family iron response transcriptional regulator